MFQLFLPSCRWGLFGLALPFVSVFAVGPPPAAAQEDEPAAASESQPELPPVLLQMSRDPAIHAELGLSRNQIEEVLAVTDQVDRVWWPSRNLPPERQREVNDRLTRGLRQRWVQICDASQRRRLRELERQALGTRMLLTPEVADALRMDASVRQAMRRIAIDTDRSAKELQRRAREGEDQQLVQRELQSLKTREREAMVELLSEEQRRGVTELVGEPFDFAQVRRNQPRAPELIASDSQWLQGAPTSLEQLRGKVVVLHFYAFQCINCRRNLPHYNGWFDDFSSDDVAIIGIQTPETPAERDRQRVRAALATEGIEYRVLFDPEERNWKAWGNTMWPTVYLIDRGGFIRTWWQGELNWQGARGEETFREIIRQLVAEPVDGSLTIAP